MNRAMIERKLADGADELRRAREELRISGEQLDHFVNEADEARIRALVSETPLAEQEYREAARHADTMRRHHDDLVAQIDRLESRQDELLDQLMGP